MTWWRVSYRDYVHYPETDVVFSGASFNNFLDALDGTYCTYDGGDDPTEDATYPDPYGGGYEGWYSFICTPLE